MTPMKKLYTPRSTGPMRVVGFMSGSGTNLIKIIEHQLLLAGERGRSPYEVVVIFTDNRKSNGADIADRFGIPLMVMDIMDFYRARGHDTKRDLSLRPDFDRTVIEALAPYRPDAVALAGYMSIVTGPLLEAFDGRIINVHPADLTVERGGRRAYTGDRAVADAIRAGESEVRSTTHIVRAEVDYGEILMVSAPVPVVLPEGDTVEALRDKANRARLLEIAEPHQDRLKEIGDWEIFPKTLEMMAEGRYGLGSSGELYIDGEPSPGGLRMGG